MSWMVSRASFWMAPTVRGALVVISPATMARLVVTSVSQATRLVGSWDRQKSRTASEIWSATLSGWPMDTDSLVNRKRSLTENSWALGRQIAGEIDESARPDGLAATQLFYIGRPGRHPVRFPRRSRSPGWGNG